MTLFYLAVLLLYTYTTAVCIKAKKIPASISASFYAIKHKWWFRFTMWVVPMLLMYPFMEISPENIQFLLFLSLVGMIMVGSAPDFKNDKCQNRIHMAGAVMACLFSQIWIFLVNPIALSIWAVYILYTFLYSAIKKINIFSKDIIRTKPMFWIEIASTLALIVSAFTLLK